MPDYPTTETRSRVADSRERARSTEALETPGVALRPYQLEALEAIEDRFNAGVRRQLVALPTGTGKTVVFAEVIRRRPGRALVLAHRGELLDQATDKIIAAAPGLRVGIVKAERDEASADVVVASVQTVASERRLGRLGGPFATVVVDEAHHAAATSYRDVIGRTVTETTLLLGVTATPGRGDGIGLDGVFDEIVYRRSIVEMIAAGYLVDLRGVQVIVPGLDLARVAVRRGDYADGDLAAALAAAHLPGIVARAWSEHAADRRGLVFTPSVALAHACAAELNAAGVPSAALDGTTPPDERADILARLGSGELQAVPNCAVLTEGFDEPTIDCIVVARPTRSQGLYLQCIGRGTRLSPGKADCLILDLVGSTGRHGLVTLAGLAGVDADEAEKRGVADLLAAARPEIAPAGTWAGEIVAGHVELFRRRPMAWVAAGRTWLVASGDGQIVLVPTAGGWDVVDRPRNAQPSTLARGLSLEWAQGFAEDVIRQRGAVWLARADAPWRAKVATGKQLDALARMRIPHPPAITAGEASDLISAKVARRAS